MYRFRLALNNQKNKNKAKKKLKDFESLLILPAVSFSLL